MDFIFNFSFTDFKFGKVFYSFILMFFNYKMARGV